MGACDTRGQGLAQRARFGAIRRPLGKRHWVHKIFISATKVRATLYKVNLGFLPLLAFLLTTDGNNVSCEDSGTVERRFILFVLLSQRKLG